MKNIFLPLLFTFIFISVHAQNRVNVYPKNSYIKENLDLNAVSQLYGQSTDLADFERRLNYPDDRISNLDLNNDDKVDYLRVSEKIENNIQIIIIQAEVSPNVYEDVATITIVLKSKSLNTTNDSGIRPKDILIPFMFTFLNVLLSRN